MCCIQLCRHIYAPNKTRQVSRQSDGCQSLEAVCVLAVGCCVSLDSSTEVTDVLVETLGAIVPSGTKDSKLAIQKQHSC